MVAIFEFNLSSKVEYEVATDFGDEEVKFLQATVSPTFRFKNARPRESEEGVSRPRRPEEVSDMSHPFKS
jgi:hypothetical protein